MTRETFNLLLEDVAHYLRTHENFAGVLFWGTVLLVIWLLGDSCGGGGRYAADIWD